MRTQNNEERKEKVREKRIEREGVSERRGVTI